MWRSFIRFAACTVAVHLHSIALAQSECTWGLVTPNGPSGQVYMCPDLTTGKLVLYQPATFYAHGRTWEWNGEAWVDLEAETGPSPRFGAMMAPFVQAPGESPCIILFGGESYPFIYNETWKWDGKLWTQVASTGPSPRAYAAMTFDSARNRIVLFGGQSLEGVAFGDTWEWDGKSWSQVSSTGPSSRRGPSMCFDTNLQKAVLFGGAPNVPTPWDAKTWGWDGSAWTILAATGPSVRHHAQIAFDSNSETAVLFSGYHGGMMSDTWKWDGKAWQLVPDSDSPMPPPRLYAGFAYDGINNGLLLTAGRDNQSGFPFSDSHHYSHCASPSNNKCPGAQLVFAGSHEFTTDGAGILYDQTSLNCDRSTAINIGADIWYLLPVECKGTLTITLCDADFDSVLAVYPPACAAVANGPIACGDNECGDDATVTLPVEYGEAFLIRIAGVNGERGSGTMVITCTKSCAADLVPNWIVDVDDLLVVINAWGACELGVPCTADIAPSGPPTGNGVVDVDDLLAVINSWGACP